MRVACSPTSRRAWWAWWLLGFLLLVSVQLWPRPSQQPTSSASRMASAAMGSSARSPVVQPERLVPLSTDDSVASKRSDTTVNAMNATTELVVCRFDEDVEWVVRLLATAPHVTAVIANHGKPIPEYLVRRGSGRLEDWALPNTMRECGCYLGHILRRYPNFAARTIFVQADACCKSALLEEARRGPGTPFVYLTDKLWYNLSSGDPETAHPGYNGRSCELQALFGGACSRSERGLWLRGPGLANFAVARHRLLAHANSVWRAAHDSLSRPWPGRGADLGTGVHSHEWVACLVFERLWHVLLGEPQLLPRELALPHYDDCAAERAAVCGAQRASAGARYRATVRAKPLARPALRKPKFASGRRQAPPSDRSQGAAGEDRGAPSSQAGVLATSTADVAVLPTSASSPRPAAVGGALPVYFVSSDQPGARLVELREQFVASARLEPAVELRERTMVLSGDGGFQGGAWKAAIFERLRYWIVAAGEAAVPASAGDTGAGGGGTDGELVVCSDIDVTFYPGWGAAVLRCLDAADICFMKGGKSYINGGFFAMRRGAVAVRFWKRVLAGVQALRPGEKGAAMLEQTVINRMLAARKTEGAQVAFYSKSLVRGGKLEGARCLQLLRVHHCAGCGNGDAKLSTLRHVTSQVAMARASPAACEEETRSAQRYLPVDAFLSDGRALKDGYNGLV